MVLQPNLSLNSNKRIAFILDAKGTGENSLAYRSENLSTLKKVVRREFVTMKESSFGMFRKLRLIKKAELVVATKHLKELREDKEIDEE